RSSQVTSAREGLLLAVGDVVRLLASKNATHAELSLRAPQWLFWIENHPYPAIHDQILADANGELQLRGLASIHLEAGRHEFLFEFFWCQLEPSLGGWREISPI